MRKLLLISFFLILLPISSSAQVEPVCPSISVSGPSRVVSPGEIAEFSANITNLQSRPYLEYIWSISAGQIVKGQGTVAIEVRVPAENSSLTVSIEVRGLPTGCANNASETQGCGLRSPDSIKINEFKGSLAHIPNERFERIGDAIKSHSDSQVIVIISGSGKVPKLSIRKKQDIVAEKLIRFMPEDSRITFIYSTATDDIVAIWLVPPGADMPKIRP